MSKYSARGDAWDKQRKRVLARDNYTCTACGLDLVGDGATVDHVEAVVHTQGKRYTDDELVSMCRSCNSRKGDRAAVRIDYRSPDWL